MKDIVNESYIIGVEISEDTALSTMVVLRRDSDALRQVNVFTGKDAEELYYKLVKRKEKENE